MFPNGPYDTHSLKWDWQGASESPTNALRGLLALSAEIVDEILSYLGCITDHTNSNDPNSSIPLLEGEYAERTKTLRALSQTCAAYRTHFLPNANAQAWPTIQSWHNMSIARVVVTRYKVEMVLPAFVSCLTSLANLHTLHLFHVHAQMTTALKNAFEGTTLPTVRSIILPGCAHEILRSCPNVTYVKCMSSNGSKLTTVINKSCPNVEVVENFCPDLALMRRIVKAIPKLKAIRLQPDIDSETVQALASSKFIQKLEFETATQAGEDFRPGLQQSILAAKKILEASLAADRKIIRVWHGKMSSRNIYTYPTSSDVGLT